MCRFVLRERRLELLLNALDDMLLSNVFISSQLVFDTNWVIQVVVIKRLFDCGVGTGRSRQVQAQVPRWSRGSDSPGRRELRTPIGIR